MKQETYDRLIDTIINLALVVQVLVRKVKKLEEKEIENDVD